MNKNLLQYADQAEQLAIAARAAALAGDQVKAFQLRARFDAVHDELEAAAREPAKAAGLAQRLKKILKLS